MKLPKFSDPSQLGTRIFLASLLILFAAGTRMLPHPANFAPIAAIAIFGGAVLPRRWALSLPLAAMILSDLVIGLHSLAWLTWGSFAVIALFSNLRIKQLKISTIPIASLAASSFFYLVSNFGVWAQGQLYPRTLAGLIDCYYMALPFFRNTLLGDLTYTALIFGAYVLAVKATSPKSDPFALPKLRP